MKNKKRKQTERMKDKQNDFPQWIWNSVEVYWKAILFTYKKIEGKNKTYKRHENSSESKKDHICLNRKQ